ncbi:peptidoglycan/xylan/chitin deacetylase (PgdA/CDA1 family) [Sporomusaceae bacterium BoRhaA]|uniref:polysaccharide deacetylase family protein n=1 Tax=Pelorhabdus rhamnosifermentans TaxID=2772457 RepID=UPI001C061B9E|nr:polysaccharide deacetylase family protein [Pelorhabdus rhamnosifermentans]MBU2700312.1 peptidoglycan/xylan/chitin deacetylase (PgdA/CDA1 family) [Pelorhabdus rhamnosifermentans]
MITRRQFLTGSAGFFAALSGLSLFSKYDLINNISNSIPILLYHRVGLEGDPLTITTSRFQKDIETLSQEGYTPLSLTQLKQHIKSPNEPLPSKPIIITFDDGYLDNYTNAFPILQKYSMKASFEIITGMVGQNDRMTIPQIREMEAAGMGFGAHTVTHRSLAELNRKDAATELTKSKADLEQIIGKTVEFIAYPGGYYTAETINLAREAGYIGGFSVNPGFAMFKDAMAIRRMPIFHYDRSISYVMLRKGLLPDMLS